MVEYVGLDVSKEETAFCVKDEAGKVLARGKVSTEPVSLFEVLREHCLCPDRIVLETETMPGWLARELDKLGLAVEVIDARQAHGSARSVRKGVPGGDAGHRETSRESADTTSPPSKPQPQNEPPPGASKDRPKSP